MADIVVTSPRPRRSRAASAKPRRRSAAKPTSEPVVTEAEIKAKLDAAKHKRPAASAPAADAVVVHSRRTLVIAISAIMVVIIGGWLWSLQYSLRLPELTPEQQARAQQWQTLKQELQTSFSSIKDNLASAKELPEIVGQSQLKLDAGAVENVEEQLVADAVTDWVSYRNFDGGLTVKYPPSWQQATGQDAALTLKGDKQTVAIATTPKAVRPEVTADQTEVFFIGSTPGTLYRETTAIGPRLTVVVPLIEQNVDLVVIGSGANLDEQTFTLLTKTITIAPPAPVAE